jgi:hypothetical protein
VDQGRIEETCHTAVELVRDAGVEAFVELKIQCRVDNRQKETCRDLPCVVDNVTVVQCKSIGLLIGKAVAYHCPDIASFSGCVQTGKPLSRQLCIELFDTRTVVPKYVDRAGEYGHKRFDLFELFFGRPV